jgi:hypothetical protein
MTELKKAANLYADKWKSNPGPFVTPEQVTYDSFLAGAQYEQTRAEKLVEAIEKSLKADGALHKPIYFLWLREALAKIGDGK